MPGQLVDVDPRGADDAAPACGSLERSPGETLGLETATGRSDRLGDGVVGSTVHDQTSHDRGPARITRLARSRSHQRITSRVSLSAELQKPWSEQCCSRSHLQAGGRGFESHRLHHRSGPCHRPYGSLPDPARRAARSGGGATHGPQCSPSSGGSERPGAAVPVLDLPVSVMVAGPGLDGELREAEVLHCPSATRAPQRR